MINVPNKPIINTLAFRQIKTRKARNLFAIAAIVLTSILVMVVLTMGVGLMDAGRLTLMKSSGQKAEISFQYLMEDEVKSIITNPLIKEYGISKYIAATNEGVWNQTTLEIRTADEYFADMLYSTPTIGRLPEN
jgi:putative ABC transport system permease protein